jgi:hypothetical protein
MRVGIDKSRENDLSLTINLDNLLAILPDPGVAQRISGPAYRDDLPGDTQHRTIFDYGKFRQIEASAGTGPIGTGAQGEELANVDQQ